MLIATPLGKQSVTYDIAVADGRVTGTATQGGDVTALLDVAASGDRLTWVKHVAKPMKLTLRFDVVVEGDRMTGSANAGLLPSSRLCGFRRHAAMASV